jgi:hypothetical protein
MSENLTVDVEGLAGAIAVCFLADWMTYDSKVKYYKEIIIRHLCPCPECQRLREELETIKGLVGQDIPDTPTGTATSIPEDYIHCVKPVSKKEMIVLEPEEYDRLTKEIAKLKAESPEASIEDIYGIDPNFTDGLSVTDFLKKQRGEDGNCPECKTLQSRLAEAEKQRDEAVKDIRWLLDVNVDFVDEAVDENDCNKFNALRAKYPVERLSKEEVNPLKD